MANNPQKQIGQDQITEHLDNILDANERMIPKMPESVFKTHLLPALVGDSQEHRMDIWLEAAGSWQRPIDVVDDESGEYLFRVPPLVGEISVKAQRGGQESAFEIIMEAQRKMKAVTSQAGLEFLREKLQSRISPSGQRDQAFERWNYIFSRYGYTDLTKGLPEGTHSGSKSQTNPVSTPTRGDDDKPSVVGYDEL